MYKKCVRTLVPFLGPIFCATFSLGIYPQEWKDSCTVIIQKQGKPDYTSPNTYRPIALLCTIAKILSPCITTELMQFAKIHQLLPNTHFSCCTGCKTTDSLYYVTSHLHNTMDSKKAACALFLDIKGAFPSINLDHLVHDMRKCDVPKECTDWIHLKTGNQCT